MKKAEARLLTAVAGLLQRVAKGEISSESAALCIENALTGLEATLATGQDKLLSKPIKDLLNRLSIRAAQVVRSILAVETIGDLVALSAEDIISSAGVGGDTVVTEIRQVLKTRDLKLRGD